MCKFTWLETYGVRGVFLISKMWIAFRLFPLDFFCNAVFNSVHGTGDTPLAPLNGGICHGASRLRSYFHWRSILAVLCVFLSTPSFAQEEWYDHYHNAKEAMAVSDWNKAERELRQALNKRTQSGLNVEEYGLRFVDYLPHYWLGVTYFNLGDFENAARQFESSRAQGVIQNAPQFKSLQLYEQTLASLQQLQQAGASLRAQQQSSARVQEQLREFENAIRRNDFTAAQTLMAAMETAQPESTAWAALKTIFQRMLEARAQLEATSAPEIDKSFEAGLAQYVAGNYAEALRLFVEVETHAPDYRQVSNWRKQTEAVMASLQLKPETITITQTVESTALPVIAFASPARDRIEIRADSILLAGSASDDRGIRALDFTLNGKPYLDARGRRVTIAPRAPSEALNLSFQLTLPLRLGENHIVVTAYDNDPTPHHSTFPKSVVRLRPWHQTPVFYVAVGVMVVLTAGSLLANVFIKRRIAFVNRYNPYIAGAPVRNEKMFYGREKLLQRLINTLPNNSLMMHGPRRIGKTSLQHQLKKRLERAEHPDYHYVPVFIDLQGVREERFFRTMMEDILEACAPLPAELTRTTERPNGYSARDFSAELQQVLAHLQSRSAKKLKLVLLLDEVDTLNAFSARVNQQLRGIFMKSFAENLVAVMSGSYIRKQWESEGSPWYNFFEEIAVPPLEKEEALALIRGPVQGIFSYEKEALEKVLAYSKCEPYRIQRLCVNAINRIIEMKRRRVTASDIEAVQAEIFQHETRG